MCKHKAHAGGYALELHRRLSPPATTDLDDEGSGSSETSIGLPTTLPAGTGVPGHVGVSSVDAIPPRITHGADGGFGPLASETGQEAQAAQAAQATEATQAETEAERGRSPEKQNLESPSEGPKGGKKTRSSYSRCHEESVTFAVLEASMLSRHGWLCVQAFRLASAAMGSGDGKGLPPHPRDLTALLALLHQFVSVLFASGVRRNTGADGDGV